MARTKFKVKEGLSVSDDVNPAGFDFLPPGLVLPYAGSVAPDGWLLCTGQAVSRSTYANLFALIGTTYGTGNGSTTFTLPNLCGRTVVGSGTGAQNNASGTGAISGGTALSARSIGGWAGGETTVIASDNLPTHQHTVNVDGNNFDTGAPSNNTSGGPSTGSTGEISANHTHTGTSNDNGHHTHAIYIAQTATAGTNRNIPNSASLTLTTGTIIEYTGTHAHTTTTGGVSANHTHSMQDHTHGLSSHSHNANHGHTASTSGTFSNTAINNMQPFLVLNYIIKY